MSAHRVVSIRLGLFLVCLLALSIRKLPAPPGLSERADRPEEAQELFRRQRAPVGETAIPVERYFRALERMRVMRQHSLAAGRFLPSRAALASQGRSYVAEARSLGAWTSLGPGNIGGRSRALVIDPRAPRTMFAAGVAGGVWKTTDGGMSWRPLDDLMANLAVSSLAMDPADSDIVYAGTGEGYFNTDAVRGAGIFKTRDGGLTWNRLPSTATPDFYYVNDLVISATRPRRIYAATRTGVWRSRDGGATWTRVLDPRAHGGCLDLALRTDRGSDVLLASCGTREGTAAVWRNAEAERKGGWSRVLTEPGMGRTSLAIAPSDQDVVYALASSNRKGRYHWGLLAVFRSDDGGRTWSERVRNDDPRKLDTLLLTNPAFALGKRCFGLPANEFYNQGWYDNVIAVDPADPDRVWAGGIDLFRSDDGGRSWALMSYWWGSVREHYVHADQHVIAFHPRYNGTTVKTMFVGNDGGIFRTRDARARGVATEQGVCNPANGKFEWTDLNNGYGVTQFYAGAAYPDGDTYFGGTQDNGTVRGTLAGGADWQTLLSGDNGFAAVNPDDTDILYSAYTYTSLMKSTDGETFFAADTGLAGARGFLFIAPYAMDPSDPDRLWAGGAALWRTDDGAAAWRPASAPLPGENVSVSAIAISPSDPDRVLAGTSTGAVHGTTEARTAGGGTVWPGSKPRDGFVSSVAFDPQDPDVAYATYSTFGGVHVWKTADGGATWTGLDGTGEGALPDLPVNAVAVDPADPRRLFLGTDLGVFVSTDGGERWAVENTGFANVVTSKLVVLENPDGSRTLFAFTHGRGVWRVPVRD